MRGIRLRVTDRDALRAVWLALVLMTEIRRLDPREFRVTNEGMTQMLGSPWARAAFDRGDEPEGIWRRWNEELAQWAPVRAKYSLYVDR